MKFKLLRYNNDAIEFDISKIISITANGNLIYETYRLYNSYRLLYCSSLNIY